MKVVKIIVVLMISFFIGISCETQTYQEISGNVTEVIPSYTTNIKPIIENNCLSCHGTGGQYPTMETYSQVRDAAENGNMICRIDDQSCGAVMPQSGRMAQTNITKIKDWVSNNFPN